MAHRGDRGTGREREAEREIEEYRPKGTRDPGRPREREYSSSSRAPNNQFFVDGEGIHREVMQREICKYLGPDALSKPGDYNGKKGFYVTAVRPFTSEMIKDMQILSQKYERERRERGRDLSYAASDTSRDNMDPYNEAARHIPQGRYGDIYPEKSYDQYSEKYLGRELDGAYQPGYSMPSGYPSGTGYPSSQTSGYPPVTGYPSAPSYPAGSAYPQGSNYPPTSGYPPSSGYVAPGYPSTSGIMGGRNEPNYIFTEQRGEYPPSGYPYQPSSTYAGGPQANPRTGATYPYVTSPSDSVLGGVSMEERAYDMYGQPMSTQSGRGGFPPPSRGTPTHFDPPQPREGFRADPSRDDRRRR